MAKEEKKGVFETLNAIDCSEHIEKKKGSNGKELSYLSWAWAWQLVKGMYPDASYVRREWEGKPYLFDPALGYYVETSVTIQGETMTMSLPVMDSSNKSQTDHPYNYTTRYGEKTVEAATMFDINTALMRCLVKNLAMFGLGLYIYAGEDIPQEAMEERKAAQKEAQEERKKRLMEAIKEVNDCLSSDEVAKLWNGKYADLKNEQSFSDAVKSRGSELKKKEASHGNAA